MATVNYYYQTANTASTLPYGNVSAGGGAGTEGSPYNSFSGVEALVEDVATDHSADDLVLHFHPACFFQAGTGNFDTWTNVGKSANSWKSVTLKRWQAIVDAQPLYATWKPTIDSTQEVLDAAWTEGSISAGVWSAGSGDVFRVTISAIAGTSPSALRWVGGHVTGDNPGSWTIAGVYCSDLTYVTEEGDYALDNTNNWLYVKTGATGVKPGARWGSFHYVINGASALQLVSCERISFENFQWSGGYLYGYSGSAGDSLHTITFINCSGRMCNSSGWIRFATDTAGHYASSVYNVTITNPDASAIEGTRVDKGTQSNERGSENGINFDVSILYNITIKNPKFTGFSHAGIQIFANEEVSTGPTPSDYDEYPRDILIYVDDTSDGKGTITGGVNYQRGINLRISKRGVVRGLRFAKCTTQSQFGGDILMQSCYWDGTNPAFSDPYGTSAYNVGICAYSFISQYGHTYTTTQVRFVGCKFDVQNSYALVWGTSIVNDFFVIDGCLIRDGGHVRYWPQADSGEYTYLRRRAPFIAQSQTGSTASKYQTLRNNLFIASSNTEGLAQYHVSGAANTVTTVINDTTWPLVQYNDTSAWGGSRISGNQQVTGTTGFDFDSSLNYTGTRKTPVQTGSGRVRGYR